MNKILIVEDDFYIRDIYLRTLKSAGYDVDVAVDGAEGIRKAADNIYNLILLDIMLPKVTGLDVLRTLRKHESKTQDTPIFMITNLGQDNIIKEAFKIGADGYLIKAEVKMEDLLAEVNRIFETNKK